MRDYKERYEASRRETKIFQQKLDEAMERLGACEAEKAEAVQQRAEAWQDLGFSREHIGWIRAHLWPEDGKKVDTQATRRFIKDRRSPEALYLLRICDLLDAESELAASRAEVERCKHVLGECIGSMRWEGMHHSSPDIVREAESLLAELEK